MTSTKFRQSISKGKDLMEEVQRLGTMKQNGVTLRYMMDFGSKATDRNLLFSAQFIHSELPIRIARRALELQTLPYGLSLKPAILKVEEDDAHEFDAK